MTKKTDFKTLALPYVEAGLSPIPIQPGTKQPGPGVDLATGWTKFCKAPPSPALIDKWNERAPEAGIGLALGTALSESEKLAAIDIDDDDLLDDVIAALGTASPGKFGRKGLTVFVRVDKTFRSKKIKRRDENGKPYPKPSVEFLSGGSQTVMPPTLHMDTGEPYVWREATLLERLDSLVLLTAEMVDEIKALCEGRGEHFSLLNCMNWLGVGKGGDTHDTCVAAVGCMVGRQWPDEAIHARIERAKAAACERAGEPYDWPESTKTIQEWIDSARRKGMDQVTASVGKQSKPRVPPERTAAEWAVDKLFEGEANVVSVDGVIRKYDSGYWREIDEVRLRSAMLRHDGMLSAQAVKAACDVIRWMYAAPDDFGRSKDGKPERYDEMLHRVCLLNCTVNLVTGETSEHSPKHELLHQLPFEWDDTAQCPKYDRVVRATFDGDARAIALWDEYCAHTLIPDMHFQKLLFLVGPGGNGKGTLSRVLQGMHDPRAIGTVSVTDLGDERKRTSLIGKLLNVSGEQSYLRNVSDVYLKKITGGDPVDCRRLYGETMGNVQLRVRFLEMTNEMPTSTDSSDALRRRLMILQTPNCVRRPDLDLDAKLRTERAGILRRWVEALQRLYHRGCFQEPRASRQAVVEYIEENDPVNSWMVNRTEATKTPREGAPTADLYADFAEWARAMGFRQPPNVTLFGRRLTQYGYTCRTVRLPMGTLRMRALRIKKGLS